jgi:tetratricopeptide (TPR) repeat protein
MNKFWTVAAAVAVAFIGFLGWYDTVRNRGGLFVCDVAALAGQSAVISFCREAPPKDGDQLALPEDLEGRQDQLSPERRAPHRQLEDNLKDRAIKALTRAAGLKATPVIDALAEADARKPARETAEKGDADERRALALIAEGDLDGGRRQLTNPAAAAARWRRIGRLAYADDTPRAIDAYAKAVALYPTDPWDLIYLGRLHLRAGALGLARASLRECAWRSHGRRADAKCPSERHRRRADRPGRPSRRAQELPDGVGHQKASRQSRSRQRRPATRSLRLAKADPSNVDRRRDLSVWHNSIGNVRKVQGDLSGALESFRAGMTITQRLAKADPGNAGWRRDLSISHTKIGDVRLAQGDLPGALKSYRAEMTIAQRLAKADPSNVVSQRDLSLSHNKIGDVLTAQGDFPGALKSARAAIAIARRLSNTDHTNTVWRRDISVSLDKIGDVLTAQGDLPGALKSYRAGMAIIERLAKSDPGNALWRLDLASRYGNMAEVMVELGKRVEALKLYRLSRALVAPMAERAELVLLIEFLNFIDAEIKALGG